MSFLGLREAAAAILQGLFKMNWMVWFWSKIRDWWEGQGTFLFWPYISDKAKPARESSPASSAVKRGLMSETHQVSSVCLNCCLNLLEDFLAFWWFFSPENSCHLVPTKWKNKDEFFLSLEFWYVCAWGWRGLRSDNSMSSIYLLFTVTCGHFVNKWLGFFSTFIH